MAPSLKGSESVRDCEAEDEAYIDTWSRMLNISKEKVRDLLGVEPKELQFEFEEKEVPKRQTEE